MKDISQCYLMFQKEYQLIPIRGPDNSGVPCTTLPMRELAMGDITESMLPQLHCGIPAQAMLPHNCFQPMSGRDSSARARQFLPNAGKLYQAVFAHGLPFAWVILPQNYTGAHTEVLPANLPSHFPFMGVRYALQPEGCFLLLSLCPSLVILQQFSCTCSLSWLLLFRGPELMQR